ncbi:reverse transcriptase domain-containing protein [Tanacetum coccineum]
MYLRLDAIDGLDGTERGYQGRCLGEVVSNSDTDGLAVIISKLDNLGRDMKKLNENVHAIQVGCQICEEPHLDKECPLNEEVKRVEEVKYREFGRLAPFNGSNRAKFHVGPLGYYTRTDNRPPYGEKRPSLEELMNKHQEESVRRNAEMKEWIMKLQENAEINTRNQSASLRILETQIEQLTKELHSRTTNEAPSSSTGQCKVVNADHETSNKEERTTEVLQCKLPPKEQNPGSFTLPCTIGDFNFYAMTDLGARVNVMPSGIFEFLKLTNLRKTNMLIEMVDMSKKAQLGVVENILVGVDKFIFPADFVIIDRTPNETVILGRSFLATIHAKIHVFNREISLGVGHKNVNESVKKALLKCWVIDCFEEALDPDKNPRERSSDDYKWVFDLEIEQLADEYKLGVGKKDHILAMIWENYKNIQGKAKEWWYDYWLEEDEKLENRYKKYDPPMVYLETFEVTRYSFDNGNSFICVTNKIKDTLSLGRENGSRFRKMIQQEMNQGEDAHDKT